MSHSSEREFALVTLDTRAIEHEGQPALLGVRSFVSPRGTIMDSALVYRSTLAPIFQYSHQPSKTMRLRFDADGVTGTFTPRDSATREVRHPLSGPVFDATDLEAVITSLPYASGYHVVLPFYSFEQATVEQDTVRLVGVESVRGRGGVTMSAWKVSFGDPFIAATFWIDRNTRRILREDIVQRRSGTRFRLQE